MLPYTVVPGSRRTAHPFRIVVTLAAPDGLDFPPLAIDTALRHWVNARLAASEQVVEVVVTEGWQTGVDTEVREPRALTQRVVVLTGTILCGGPAHTREMEDVLSDLAGALIQHGNPPRVEVNFAGHSWIVMNSEEEA